MILTQAPPPVFNHNSTECKAHTRPVHDTLDVLSGRWKLQILGALMFGAHRFNELQRVLPGITSKVLSKELKELEQNDLVERRVIEQFPVAVVYSITEYGETLKDVLMVLKDWGANHRKRMMQG